MSIIFNSYQKLSRYIQVFTDANYLNWLSFPIFLGQILNFENRPINTLLYNILCATMPKVAVYQYLYTIMQNGEKTSSWKDYF